jgi:biopolymer transport protein ExbD
LIDVMLFLLVFFMLSSLSLTRLQGLPVQLPRAQTAPAQNADVPTLTVRRDGALFLGREAVARRDLPAKLKPFANQSLLINADARVSHGVVAACMDAANAAGIERFSIATTR